MADVLRETKIIERDSGDVDRRTEPTGTTIAARVVNIITGIIVVLLAARFIFSLLGANRDSAIGGFVYDVTQPLVAPFFSLFNYRTEYGISSFEFQTLVAILFYAFLGWLLIKLFTIADRDNDARV